MLLGFKLDQFLDVILIERRKLHEPGENRLPGHGVANLFPPHLQGGRQLFDRESNLREAREILRGVCKNRLRAV